MKTIEQIRIRKLNNELSDPEVRALELGFKQDLPTTVNHLRGLYQLALHYALKHKSNDGLVREIITLAWVLGSTTDYDNLPYLQFNLPRLRVIAREFLFPWPNNSVLWSMAAGDPCSVECLKCHGGVDSA